ncbi:hypothetical protein [Bernardetia sp.]|uniref:hypothetical protein n=1 Tax=Bernardetia sp. TaxID=1937974 RepID=UPI0025C43C5D|nr:hypothetical protein [Bernardetia sp.]
MKIQIAEPCSENWDRMTSQDKGRFCGACQKVVIDFTTMTDTEIINHFQNYKGNTCGRFHETQLDTHLKSIEKAKSSFWSKFVAAGFALFLISMPSYSNNFPTDKSQSSLLQKQTKPSDKKINDDNHIKIEGTVTDSLRYSISDAIISIKEIKVTQITDANGNFEILIPKEVLRNTPILTFEINKFGYTTTTLTLDFSDEKTQNSYLHFILKEAVVLEEEAHESIRMGAVLSVKIVEKDHCTSDSTQNVEQEGVYGKEAEISITEKKSFWQYFKSIFNKK